MNSNSITLTHEQVGNLLADLVDIRSVLSQKILNKPKDEDSAFTIGDLLDEHIEFLQNIEV